MLDSYVLVIFVIGVTLTLLSLIFVYSRPDISFISSLFAILTFVYSAYGANYVEIPATLLTNNTSTVALTYARDLGLMWLSVFGLLLNAVLIWYASVQYGAGR